MVISGGKPSSHELACRVELDPNPNSKRIKKMFLFLIPRHHHGFYDVFCFDRPFVVGLVCPSMGHQVECNPN